MLGTRTDFNARHHALRQTVRAVPAAATSSRASGVGAEQVQPSAFDIEGKLESSQASSKNIPRQTPKVVPASATSSRASGVGAAQVQPSAFDTEGQFK
ncbi:hypothetical protein [Limnohabitans sp. JirII-29]|uniref:hypothetical protein n=1 Tax=Limnohabitans sp. JirII-29 TaxID=1835756 RepID=UPI0011B24E40|nr:hypothetical protein [Limnohabitans sp. JirII-29]